MLPLEAIPCPHCGKVQEEDIYDLMDGVEEMEGEFKHTCQKCEQEFNVEFRFIPQIHTS